MHGLISECSYPWAVEPAGLNGSIRHQLSGEGSGGELERCLRWGSSWSDRRRHRRKTHAGQVVPYRNLIGERGHEAHATAAVGAKGAVKVKNPGAKSSPCSAMRPSLGGDGGGGLDAGASTSGAGTI